jgi:multidrug efflux pump subunit AcrA (membrane-fusion protein)
MTNSEDSSVPPEPETTSAPDASRPPDGDSAPPGTEAVRPSTIARRIPGRFASLRLLAAADMDSILRSWLTRGFLIASGLLTVLALKGMQADDKTASQMLEAAYVTYLLLWMHGVIFIAGGAFAREQDCLNDAILSRGLTRGEYIGGKLLARGLAILVMIGGVLLPASFWAIRQDQLVRSEAGQVVSKARNTKVEAWEPKKIFAGTDGRVQELKVKAGDEVRAGDVLLVLDDRQLFDQLETERRAEETARNEVGNARRRFEDAQRSVAQVEDALTRAERSLAAKDLMSRFEQSDREIEIRSRKRDLQTAQNQLQVAQDAITVAERAVENSQARVREARKRLAEATVTAPLSGFATEVLVQAAQYVTLGTHLLTVARLDEFEVRVPVYDFDEFKRLKAGLKAFIKIGKTEFTGEIDKLGPTTQTDRWGRPSNYAVVRFKGDGTMGLLGLDADVRIVLPPHEEKPDRVTALLNTLTGHGVDDVGSKTTSVTYGWMAIGLGKVLGCALMLVTLTLLLLVVFRSALMAILAAAGLWHVSNLLFDFAGLPELSYLEMVRTMDKVLGGVANRPDELIALAWLYGIALALGALTVMLFVSRDPPK